MGRKAAPTTTPVHTERARRRAGRVGLRAAAVRAIPVRAPLPHIAAHVVDAELVGRLCAHLVGFAAAVAIIPSHLAQVVAAAEDIASRLGAAAGGVFPLIAVR